MEVESKDLIVGKKYEVSSDDCCLDVTAHGIFLGWYIDEETKEPDYEGVYFDFGKVWGYRLRFEEIE